MNRSAFFELKIPPPVVFLASAGLVWLFSSAVPWAAFSVPMKDLIALAVAGTGGIIAAYAILSFLLAKTTVHPDTPEKTTKLVVTGVYAMSRNPMYLSLLFVLIAWAVYLSNPAAFVPVPLFVVYMNRFQIGPEERILASRFGSEYEAYCGRVRRWI